MKNRVPVLLWLYHVDLWPEILSLLIPIQDLIELHIGLYKNNEQNFIVEDSIPTIFDVYNITYHDNMGGDVLPFLEQLNSLDSSRFEHDLFLKIHTKKSLFAGKINWRIILLHNLIGNRSIFLKNLDKLKDNKCGALTCSNLIMSDMEHTNSSIIEHISENILSIPYGKVKNKKFCGGNMFFGKISTFRSYFNNDTLSLIRPKLKKEKGKISDVKKGTYAHSLERLFGYIVLDNNQKIIPSALEATKILNPLAQNNKLHIILLYDEISCYIHEDINVCGKILSRSDKAIEIEWFHLTKPVIKKYKYISNNTLVSDATI